MSFVGFYMMIALIVAAAVYGRSDKGKARPAFTSEKKKFVIFLAGVTLACALLMFAVAMISASHPPQ